MYPHQENQGVAYIWYISPSTYLQLNCSVVMLHQATGGRLRPRQTPPHPHDTENPPTKDIVEDNL